MEPRSRRQGPGSGPVLGFIVRRIRLRVQVRPPESRSGFALVETLATLAIAGAVLVALSSLTGLLARQTYVLADRLQRHENAERGVEALVRDIRLAARARWSGIGLRPFVFSGTPDEILFVRHQRDQAGLARITVIHIQSVLGSQEGMLLRAEAPWAIEGTGPDSLAFGPADTLTEISWPIRFAYVRAASPYDPERVLDTWSAADAMPVAVNISRLEPSSGRVVSSVRVPLRISAEPGCASPSKAFCSRLDGTTPLDDDAASVDPALGGRHLEKR